jgi:hypothetical protein
MKEFYTKSHSRKPSCVSYQPRVKNYKKNPDISYRSKLGNIKNVLDDGQSVNRNMY